MSVLNITQVEKFAFLVKAVESAHFTTTSTDSPVPSTSSSSAALSHFDHLLMNHSSPSAEPRHEVESEMTRYFRILDSPSTQRHSSLDPHRASDFFLNKR
eukprot:GHVO01007263.1.p1 GENE.GHVO01007263.1~~GHVO01007263.1.p1  ORF type:complete len:100 (-),score=2.27 GHVO01007263.1:114-413(-)